MRPKLVVAMGATAVQSLMGKAASITSLRGKKLELPDGAALLVTVHPSYLLRMPDRDRAAEELTRFEADLRAVRAFIDRRGDEVRHGGRAAQGRAAALDSAGGPNLRRPRLGARRSADARRAAAG